MNEKAAHLNELQPIAQRIREREEEIAACSQRVIQKDLANLTAWGIEQGRDILLAKTKLGGAVKWSDWLHAHVPNVRETKAAQYERMASEQIDDIRQCLFVFMPKEDKPERIERMKPAAWETCWGYINKLARVQFDGWPKEQVDLTRDNIAEIVKRMGGEVRWKA